MLFSKNLILNHFDGDMTKEIYSCVWKLDHCFPISSFNLLDEKGMKKCFSLIF